MVYGSENKQAPPMNINRAWLLISTSDAIEISTYRYAFLAMLF